MNRSPKQFVSLKREVEHGVRKQVTTLYEIDQFCANFF